MRAALLLIIAFISFSLPSFSYAEIVSDPSTVCSKSTCNCYLPSGASLPSGGTVIGGGVQATGPEDLKSVTDCNDACVVELNIDNASDEARMQNTFNCQVILPATANNIDEPLAPVLNVPFNYYDPKLGKWVTFDVADKVGSEKNQYFKSSLLGEYVRAIYLAALIPASIIAVTMLMIAGLQYATARGDAGQVSQAKERIRNAVTGIILLLLAYNIAFILDPSTVFFRPLSIQTIDEEQLLNPNGEDTNLNPRTDLTGQTVPITGSYIVGVGNLIPEAIPDLQAAANSFHSSTGNSIKITSAFRSTRTQAGYFYDNCIRNGGECQPTTCNPAKNSSVVTQTGSKWELAGTLATASDANSIISGLAANSIPGNCPHTSGIAVDAWCNDGGSNYKHNPICQQSLIKAMTSNGFCRLASEPWHFEWVGDGKSPISKACGVNNSSIIYTNGNPPLSCEVWDFLEDKCLD